jgi:hypothetical protein
MSYVKAMKHARNVRKSRAQGHMHFGFDTGSTWPAASPAVRLRADIGRWFAERHTDSKGVLYVRECIREAIAELRALVSP